MEQQVIDYCKNLVVKGGVNFRYVTLSAIGNGTNYIKNLGANYALVYKADTKAGMSYQTGYGICHGALTNASYDGELNTSRANAIALVTLVMPFEGAHKEKHQWDEGLLSLWYNWIANESHARDVFITKDAKEMMAEGCILDATAPMNLFNLACILTRVPSEIHARKFGIDVLQSALKAGVYPALACSAAMGASNVLARIFDNPTYILSGVISTSTGHSHCPYPIYGRTKEEWKLFFNGEVIKGAIKAPYNQKGSWGGVFDLTRSDAYGATPDFVNKLNDKIEKSGLLGSIVKSGFDSYFILEKEPDVNAICDIITKDLLSFQEEMMKEDTPKAANKLPTINGEELAVKPSKVRKPKPRKKYGESL